MDEKIIFITGVLVLTLFSAKIVMVDFGEVNLDYGNLTEGHIKTAETYDLVINESLTWYGDFIVNETDTVVIKNCNFTVKNGMIFVYGTMHVESSTIRMWNTFSRRKDVYVYGNFTMLNSQILKENQINCYPYSQVFILNSTSSTTSCYTEENSDLFVSNSILYGIRNGGGQVSFINSACWMEFFDFYNGKFFALNSNFTNILLVNLQYEGNLEVQPGFIENFMIYYEPLSVNFTLVNSSVACWDVYCSSLEGKISNSVIGTLDFGCIHSWSGNLTLGPGYIQYLRLNCTRYPLIIENSTILEWRMGIASNTSVRLLDSRNVIIDVIDSAELFMLNSSAIYVCTHEHFSGTLFATNTTINSLHIRLMDISLNLTLHEGFYEFFSFLVPECGCNITLADSTIGHWLIQAGQNSDLNIFNSTLTRGLWWCPYDLLAMRNSSCSVYNSDLELIYCFGYSEYHPTLKLINCTVDALYAYDGTNVTAVNSTINMLITDPISVKLVNSKILLELDFSFEMTYEDAITSTFLKEFSPPLPENVQRFSQYVNITTAYDDYFEAQVRIYYNETELEEAGTSENDLQMYFLGESNIWQLCSIQGVNTRENYVWANVTHFSYFVLGVASGWKTSFIGLGGYPIVDFAVYNGQLYAAADNMLYVYDGNSWNIIDAPAFVVSLESYQDKLIIGGKGGLYSFNGTNFNLIFSVPTYIKALGAHNNTFYAGTMLDKPPTLYYCNGSVENPDNWFIDTDFSTVLNFSEPFGSIDSFAIYADKVYVSSGGTVYCFNGTGWSIVKTYDDVFAFLDMQVYNGKLYLATRDQSWRKPLYQGGMGFSGRVIEFDANNWTIVFDHDYWIYSLETYGNKLYAGTANKIFTYNGINWETSFSSEEGAYYAISLITYDSKIYAGMGNGYIFEDPPFETFTTIPEFPSFIISPLFIILSTIVVVVFAKNKVLKKPRI